MTLKQLAITEFNTQGEWRREPATIFENSKHEVWLKNEGGFCTMQAYSKDKKVSGRKYSKSVVVGYYDPGAGMWVESEHLENDYPTWVNETKRLWGMI